MGMSIHKGDDTVIIKLSGELDHHMTSGIRNQADEAIKSRSPSTVILDFSDITFMDSSGIGLVMGRYRLLQNTGGKIVIRGASSSIMSVMKMAGLERLAEFERGQTDESDK